MTTGRLLLVYDKQCPICDAYCRLVKIDDSFGSLRTVDAREESDVLQEISRHGMDIDQGMVLKADDQLHYGADAIHALAQISSRDGVFNRINFWLFRSRTGSRLIYPVLRFFRNLLLKILGRKKINNLKLDDNEFF